MRSAVSIALLLLISTAGCRRDSKGASDARPVVVYTSVDEAFARQVLDRYEQKTGRELAPVFDSEAGKTTGLVQKIRLEAERPRADVLWSSEIFNTILLAREGLLASYEPKTATDIPPRYRDAENRWTAVGLRARVIAFDSKDIQVESLPSNWEQLAEPRHASRLAFANPLFGTTRGHVAAMFALWGEDRGRTFLQGLAEHGALMADGNSAAVRAVLDGRAALCATDTDDVLVARAARPSLDQRYLDMGDGGTLLIPCTAALIKGAPTPEAAHDLIDFLVSAEVERLLAESDSGNIPVRAALRDELDMTLPPETKVSFDAVADAMPASVEAVREILIR